MKLAVIAGEASGDLHASEVVAELKKLDPDLQLFGIGGDLLEKQGMRLLHHAREMGVVGFFNVLRNVHMFRRIFKELVAELAAERPDAVLLVDYPGFNLRVARKCREMGVRVIYYISPQVWAWRRGRVRHIARTVDRMIVLFPFEEEFYRGHGVPVTYVGHPLVEQLGEIERQRSQAADRRSQATGSATGHPRPATTLALLPGSRRMEVASLLPPMLEAVAVLRRRRNVEAFIVQAPTINVEQLRHLVAKSGVDVPIVPPDGGRAVAGADLALSASGTATLECAVLGTPVVVMYRLSAVTYWLAQRLVKVPYFSLVNIVAGRKVVPELIQQYVRGETIAEVAEEMLEPSAYAKLKKELAEVKEKLGGPGASRRAAEEIMGSVGRSQIAGRGEDLRRPAARDPRPGNQ